MLSGELVLQLLEVWRLILLLEVSETETRVFRISALIYSSGEKLQSVLSSARGQKEMCELVCGEAVKGQFVKLFVVLEDFNNSWSPAAAAEWGASRTSEVSERISADEFVLSWRKHKWSRRRGTRRPVLSAPSACFYLYQLFISSSRPQRPAPPAAV